MIRDCIGEGAKGAKPMNVRATTIGLGPFQPAIVFEGETWVHPEKYTNEDQAGDVANDLLFKIISLTKSQIIHSGFTYKKD